MTQHPGAAIHRLNKETQNKIIAKQKTLQKQKTRVDEMLDSSPYAQEFKTSGAKSSLVDKVKVAHGITRQNTKGAADKVQVRSFGRRDSATANGTENRRKSTNNSKLNDRIQEK